MSFGQEMKGAKVSLALLFMTISSFDAFSIKKRQFSLYQPNQSLGKWPSTYYISAHFFLIFLPHQLKMSAKIFLTYLLLVTKLELWRLCVPQLTQASFLQKIKCCKMVFYICNTDMALYCQNYEVWTLKVKKHLNLSKLFFVE